MSEETPFVDRTWVARDGLTLYARDYAGAPGPARLPVICLHGLTRNSRDFEEVAPWVAAAGRRVLVPDVRGRGRSDRDPRARYRPDVYAADVLELMARLGVARAVFVGTSMGGLITMAVAARRSSAVAAAVLNDVGPRVSPRGVARIAGYVGKAERVETWADAAAYARRINEAALPHLDEAAWEGVARRLFREDASGKPVLDYDPRIGAPLQDGKVPSSSVLAWVLFGWLARRRPTLVLRGAQSDILDAETLAGMRRLAPRMACAEIDGVGHAPLLTEPEARAVLGQFLAGCA